MNIQVFSLQLRHGQEKKAIGKKGIVRKREGQREMRIEGKKHGQTRIYT